MSDLPSGTVTFLFSDIEGSTRLAQQFAAAWPAAKARHHAILRTAIESHNGYIFQVTGDAFCAAFQTGPAALAAALDAQRALHATDWGEAVIRARMGIHTGTATVLESGDYDGYLTLVRVQRIMSAARGGQVLISREAADLIQRDLPAGIALHPIGTHQLKDLAAPEHLHQVVAPGLPAEFPPLKTADVPNNLPRLLTSFIGRENEIAEIRRMLSDASLVTLTGPGGVGKTRLSLQVATEERSAFPDGVWFVELAPLADPALIANTIASAAGVREEPSRPMLATLGDHFRARTVLLIIDNCEHVVSEVAHIADQLLHTAPHLAVIATSRESLNIPGEQAYRVQPLALPASGASFDLVTQSASVRLFEARARAVKSDFILSPSSAVAVARVCQRLDGIPLAIELAAARIKALSTEQIAVRLDDRFRLLTGGSRTLLPRQQTLRALIDWSYGLLAESERALLRRLSVFAGGWTLEAAEAVCAMDGIGTCEILDLLTGLVDKSLVTVESKDDARYQMLETIRQYGREKLAESGEAAALRTRHLAYFVDAVVDAVPQGNAFILAQWNRKLDSNKDNLSAALEWATTSNTTDDAAAGHQSAPALGMRLAAELGWYWYMGSNWTEGTDILQRLVSHPANAAPSADRARALNALGHLQAMQGQHATAHANLDEALQYGSQSNDQLITKRALEFLAYVSESLGNHAEARALLDRSATLAREAGDEHHRGWALVSIGEGLLLQGELASAQQLLEEAITLLRALGDRSILAWALRRMGQVRMALSDISGAAQFCGESLALNAELKEPRGSALSVAAIGGIAAATGQLVLAARLLGAADSLLDAYRVTWSAAERGFWDTNVATVRATLPAPAFEATWQAGRALSLDQAVSEAALLQVAPRPEVPPDLPGGLTAREIEVLRWLARGLSDAEIAEQLVLSVRTVNAHLRSIYSKLDVTTRTAAVRAAIELKLS